MNFIIDKERLLNKCNQEGMEDYSSLKLAKFDKSYMKMAYLWAENSYCVRKQVGAIMVKEGAIISDGYNGTISGTENICEYDDGKTKQEVLHAEANAITKVAKSTQSSLGSTLYVTCMPCIECAKLIIQSGIVRVVYAEDYRKKEGLELLKRSGIAITYLENYA